MGSDDDDDAPRKRKKSNFSDAAPAEPKTDDLVTSFLDEINNPAPARPPRPAAAPPPPAGYAGSKPPPALYFDVVRGDGQGRDDLLGRLDLSGASQLTFGRDASRVDIPLEHASVSRHHATMTFDGDAAYVSDIKSTHGTYLTKKGGEDGEKKITELTRMEEGDHIRFGESSRRYVFRKNAAAAAAANEPPPALTPTEVVVNLVVSEHAVPRLTGLKGRTLEAVYMRTGARLQVKPKPAEDDYQNRGLRVVEVKGPVDAVAAARLELLAITNDAPPPAASAAALGGQRFRYASTVISARGEDDDLYDGGQFGKPGKI
mmetsp:Transcript_5234/g.16522  ORF Transcript_5234/g.16522 Transcript_5234/m.16522 type:complete len:317 (+) Transcript_5234:1014-1964(+)